MKCCDAVWIRVMYYRVATSIYHVQSMWYPPGIKGGGYTPHLPHALSAFPFQIECSPSPWVHFQRRLPPLWLHDLLPCWAFVLEKKNCGDGRTFVLIWKHIAIGRGKPFLELHSGGGSVTNSAINALSALGPCPTPQCIINAGGISRSKGAIQTAFMPCSSNPWYSMRLGSGWA